MPITQHRFMEVINASAEILNTQRVLADVGKDMFANIGELNSLMDRLKDPGAKEVLGNAISHVNHILTIIADSNMVSAELMGIVQTEKKYFQRFSRRNDRMAEYLRRKRKGEVKADTKAEIEAESNLAMLDEDTSTAVDPALLEAWQSGKPASEISPYVKSHSGTISDPVGTISEGEHGMDKVDPNKDVI